VSLERIRNFGIIAHIDAGKTTTTERVLFYTRKIHKVGNVDEGTTETDWHPEERRRGISIFSAAVTCEWRGHMLNLIDTPGHVDFTAEVERSLRVLDGAVVVLDAVNGVEAQSETVWRQAVRYGVPRLAYVNKMDRPGASFEGALESMRRKLSARPVAVTIPLGAESSFRGVVDLVSMSLLTFQGERGEEVARAPVPEEIRAEAEMYRELLVEAASEFSDEVLSHALEGRPVPEAALRAALRAGTVAGKIQPAYAGSSLHNQGVQPLLDGVVDFLPSPADVPVVSGRDPETDAPLSLDLRKDRVLCALAFKTETDKHGELTYARVYTGTLRAGDAFYNPRLGRMERTQQMYRMFSHARAESLLEAGPGEIVALVGLKQTMTGDTLCDRRRPIVLEAMRFPEPVLSVAIEPRSGADKDKLDEVLRRLMKDDPTFKVGQDPDTGQTILHCMGELHAEILLYRIRNEFNVPANVGEPRVAYREAILAPARAEERYTVRAGEKTLFGHVALELRPSPGTLVPAMKVELPPEREKELRRFLPAIKEGALSAAGSGALAGFPMIYLEVAVVGGSVTPESAEQAYSAAAVNAFAKALREAPSTILEPHMKFEVTVPDEYAGGVLNDLQRRGAEITDVSAAGGARAIRGHVPLSKMFGYTTTLRSLTQGRGQHLLEPFEYRPLPPEELERFRGEGG
jgi:elongation factor G